MKIRKILIVGRMGSGKTTLARKLSKNLKLMHLEFDRFQYKDKNYQSKYTNAQRAKELKEAVNKDSWIMEGVHTKDWIAPAFKESDLIILLNFSLPLTTKRIIKRFLKRRKRFGKKESLPRFLWLLKENLKYRRVKLPKHFALAKKSKAKHIIIKNQLQLNKLIKKLK